MASGLFALLDDVAALTKLAAASLDDVTAAATRAGTKSVGVIIDDAAVTPKYVTGVQASRELPMVWAIAKGSIKNKLVFLIPVFMLLTAFAPWALTPILMVGGAYLCFEAAEKILEKLGLVSHGAAGSEADEPLDPLTREQNTVTSAIRTDFILSAEILAISLGEIGEVSLMTTLISLVIVSFGVTLLVYGAVALIVKMDDIGVSIARNSTGLARRFGRAMVRFVPKLLAALSIIGTAAMAWVGGGIIIHGMEVLNVLPQIPHLFHGWADQVSAMAPVAQGLVNWFVNATLAGLLGLAVGSAVAAVVGLVGKLRGAH